MKKIIIAVLTLITYTNLYSQAFNSEEDVYKYLKDNITNIDRIEGIYKYSSFTQKNNDEPVKVAMASVNVAIVADKDVYNAYWITNGSRLLNQKSFMQVKKRDYLKIYEATFYGSEPKEVEFIGDNNFRVYKEKAKRKTDSSSESNLYAFEKTFPTKADIEAAMPKAAKCTGFLINTNLIVTNLSVVEKAKSIKIRGIKSDFAKTYTGTILQSDKNNDLALISLEDPTLKLTSAITINNATLETGNEVLILGYPSTAATADEIKLTNSIVSSKSGFQGDATSYQLNNGVDLGNIGGPVFDKKGALIGIINGRNAGAENSSYCIKAAYLNGLLNSLPVKVKMPATNLLAAKPLSEKIKALDKLVYFIEVEY
jgi:S1-C subfamily serine protease